jgi:hypothetical protein
MTKQRGYYKIKLGGKERTLHFSMNFWAAFTENMDIGLEGLSEVFAGNLSLKAIRCLVYCGILTNDQEQGNAIDYNEFSVGIWLEDITAEQLEQIIAAMAESRILGNDMNMGIERNAKTTKAGK